MSTHHVAITAVLNRLSEHLDMLAGQILTTEEAVGKALSGDKTEIAKSVTRLQSLDYLRQSLEDCAMLSLLLAKSHSDSPEARVDTVQVSEKLRLETTKSLVCSDFRKRADFGDVQLF